ncbi:hypothetical protein AVEN_194090-1 [Araneus ventricosus]|uniref:Uncharacterized protein n=1 Tax=Araneus ventricosus TaxID=182803 RepID=A0A4Y2JAZ0_ARAVE|nr:hypothetical protein AVEN_194090-1 [Araneus ventricosus]
MVSRWPSDYFHFPKLEDHLYATRFSSGSDVKTAAENWLNRQGRDFCQAGLNSELLAIDVVLETIMSEGNFGDLWILTDSRSSIQHLKNRTFIGDKTSSSILQKLKLIYLQHDVHFQCIPSHVDIHGNELSNNLAKEGSSHPIPSSSEITFLELFSRKKAQNKAEWLVPPSHHWYKVIKPRLSLSQVSTGTVGL